MAPSTSLPEPAEEAEEPKAEPLEEEEEPNEEEEEPNEEEEEPIIRRAASSPLTDLNLLSKPEPDLPDVLKSSRLELLKSSRPEVR